MVVLIGEDTAKRKWVKYEIKKAWNEGKGVLGIYIHNLKDPKVVNVVEKEEIHLSNLNLKKMVLNYLILSIVMILNLQMPIIILQTI